MRKPLLIIIVFLCFCSGTVAGAADSPSMRDYRAANALLASGKYVQSIALYSKILDAPPAPLSAGDIRVKIGDAYFRMNDFRRALDFYRMAIRDQKPSDRPQTQYWIGFCCFLTGRDADAVQELLKVPQLYPDAGAWATTAYYWAGRASERMGNTQQAAEYYRKAGGNGKSTQGRFALKKAEAAKGK